jgi:hypothetical protein
MIEWTDLLWTDLLIASSVYLVLKVVCYEDFI